MYGEEHPSDEPARPWNDPRWRPPTDDGLDTDTAVTLMPEYGVELPLWGMDWWRLGLTPELLNALADWQEQFNAGFEPDAGWRDGGDSSAWERRATELVEALRSELPPTISLTVNLWPIPSRQSQTSLRRALRRIQR